MIQTMGFAGYEHDQESGLSYASVRYYAGMSRYPFFLTPDPMSHKYPHLTSYHYCSNNPIMRVDPTGLFDLEGATEGQSYGIVAVFPTNYCDVDLEEGSNALEMDVENARELGIPLLFVDDVADMGDGLAKISELGISVETYSLNSHGGVGTFDIGYESVDKKTDFSPLKDGLSNKNVFIYACDVTNKPSGTDLTKSLAGQTNSTVFSADQTMYSGYNYDNRSLNKSNVFYSIGNLFGGNFGNKFHLSQPSGSSEQIYNLTIDRNGTPNYTRK